MWAMISGSVSGIRSRAPRRCRARSASCSVSAGAADTGAAYYLWLLAYISLSLGILNLLPFLPLDGGHILLVADRADRGAGRSRARRLERVSMVRHRARRAVPVPVRAAQRPAGRASRARDARAAVPRQATYPDAAMASERRSRSAASPSAAARPVAVQSMTTTKTHDVEATLGADRGRCARPAATSCAWPCPGCPTPTRCPAIVAGSPLPVIADIHFNASLALRAMDAGVAARAHQPRQHRRRRQGRAGRAAGQRRPARRCGSAPTRARCPTTCASSRPTIRPARWSRRRWRRCGCSSGSGSASSRSRSSRRRCR